MRMRSILPISLLLFSSCAHPLKQTRVNTLQPEASAPIVQPIPIPRPPNIDQIFNGDPQVISFGEIHKVEFLSYPSTAEHFANMIMPLLPEHGITDLVIEFLPDDPVIDQELAIFRETGWIDDRVPTIWRWISGPDRCGIFAILRAARLNGITVHGGHLNLSEMPDPDRLAIAVEADLESVAERIGQHTYARINQLLAEGRRVASYGGMRHNDFNPSTTNAAASYGDELYTRFGDSYREVDLLVPELAPGYTEHIQLDNWENMLPEPGTRFTMVTQEHRTLIMFPYTSNIHPVEPSRPCSL